MLSDDELVHVYLDAYAKGFPEAQRAGLRAVERAVIARLAQGVDVEALARWDAIKCTHREPTKIHERAPAWLKRDSRYSPACPKCVATKIRTALAQQRVAWERNRG